MIADAACTVARSAILTSVLHSFPAPLLWAARSPVIACSEILAFALGVLVLGAPLLLTGGPESGRRLSSLFRSSKGPGPHFWRGASVLLAAPACGAQVVILSELVSAARSRARWPQDPEVGPYPAEWLF